MFTMTHADIRIAAIISAAGYQVEVIKKTASPRCLFEFEDTPQIRNLINDYELRRSMTIPPKSIMDAHTRLLISCKNLNIGRIGGGL